MTKLIIDTAKKSCKEILRPCPMSGEFNLANMTASETWLNIMLPGIYNNEVYFKFLSENFTLKHSVISEVYEKSL